MPLSIDQWHQRYQQQAQWTHDIRKYIYDRVKIVQAQNILDVGCGSGVLEAELAQLTSAQVFGVDIDRQAIYFARLVAPGAVFTLGDGLQLPFQTAAFDITQCHFLLLWLKDAQAAITEFSRVTRPGGYVLATAEPDYGGRIDYPAELSQLGSWQCEALQEQGANPYIGRQLRQLFTTAGLVDIEAGVLGAQWRSQERGAGLGLEWQVIHSDLDQNPSFIQQASQLYTADNISRKAGSRVLFVPTFYAFGMVKG
jgi:ubiquinone/menaquinone biosynthesis C-methylase UbiE